MNFLPKSLFGRLFLLILCFMLCVIVLIRLLFGFVIAGNAGQHLANYSQSLIFFAEEINRLGTVESNLRFAAQLQKNTGMILLQNTIKPFDPIPDMPFYKRWETTLNKISHNEITLSYQYTPEEITWLHHQKPPLLSLGLPSAVNINIMTKFLSVSVLVTLIFTLFSTYVAAYFLNRPLKNLAEKAALIGQQINNIELKPSGPQEVQEVANAMHKMRTDLESISQKQKFLLAGISHDLRTPLTRIRLAAQLLPADTEGLIEGINADIDEMNESLHRFIELARFNIDETEFWQVGDIATVIREVVEKYQHSGSVIILSLSQTPTTRYKLKGLQSYLHNVINNSINHGAGHITIRTQTLGDCIELCVSDQGLGFPMSANELIAYSDSSTDQNNVNGLGLRIIQLIATMHEAELTLQNIPEGGAEVILKLKTFN
jgi:two-component system, OmpR family, osmolarity sensor histidine kinase EnvZ